VSGFALILAALAFPGSPQIYGPPAPAPRSVPSLNPGVGHEVRDVRSDIDKGRDQGQLSRSQAKHLKREAGEIRRLQERYGRDGLSDQEQAELFNRVEVLKALTNAKRIGQLK